MSIFKREVSLTEQEERLVNVVTSMLSREDCLIEINPENMDYLLSIEELQYFLLVDAEGVQLSNHTYFITRRLRTNVLDKIKTLIKIETSARRSAKIDSIFKNELDLLTKINNTIGNVSSK
jgi:penicillin-binding protein-related factor A (putative recombinase)